MEDKTAFEDLLMGKALETELDEQIVFNQLEPQNAQDDAIILEFKVYRPKMEKSLEETVQNALAQIDKIQYAAILQGKGYAPERIRKYGFAFDGKNVLIGRANQ